MGKNREYEEQRQKREDELLRQFGVDPVEKRRLEFEKALRAGREADERANRGR